MLALVRTDILRILAKQPAHVARQVEPSVAVWELNDPSVFTRNRKTISSQVDGCRREILQSFIQASERCSIVHGEDPDRADVPGTWERVAPTTWILPRDADLNDHRTEYWLTSPGDWVVYAGAAVIVDDWIDPFTRDRLNLVTWMGMRGVEAMISAFPDAIEWRVALGEAVQA